MRLKVLCCGSYCLLALTKMGRITLCCMFAFVIIVTYTTQAGTAGAKQRGNATRAAKGPTDTSSLLEMIAEGQDTAGIIACIVEHRCLDKHLKSVCLTCTFLHTFIGM
jgi:hypothetical protein